MWAALPVNCAVCYYVSCSTSKLRCVLVWAALLANCAVHWSVSCSTSTLRCALVCEQICQGTLLLTGLWPALLVSCSVAELRCRLVPELLFQWGCWISELISPWANLSVSCSVLKCRLSTGGVRRRLLFRCLSTSHWCVLDQSVGRCTCTLW